MDPEIEEWIDHKWSQTELRRTKEGEQAVFVLNNLAGPARREILGRGQPITESA